MDDVTLDDRIQLHELAARYANAIDARDWDRFQTVFTPDCRYELRGFGRLDTVLVGVGALRQYMIDSTAHPVAHHVTNVEVDATDEAVRMFSKVVAPLPGGTCASVDYDDVVVKGPHGWQIADRTVTLRRPPR